MTTCTLLVPLLWAVLDHYGLWLYPVLVVSLLTLATYLEYQAKQH